jgi:hypothetical protein
LSSAARSSDQETPYPGGWCPFDRTASIFEAQALDTVIEQSTDQVEGVLPAANGSSPAGAEILSS